MALTLYHSVGNYRACKLFIAAEILKVQLNTKIVGLQDLTSPDFLAKNPFGRLPVLETPEGTIHEGNTVLRHIARLGKGLYGKTAFQAAQIESWLDFAGVQLEPAGVGTIIPILGHATTTPERFKEFKKHLNEVAKVLDEQLKGHTYLVGNDLSIADLAILMPLFFAFRLVFTEDNRKQLPNLTKWF